MGSGFSKYKGKSSNSSSDVVKRNWKPVIFFETVRPQSTCTTLDKMMGSVTSPISIIEKYFRIRQLRLVNFIPRIRRQVSRGAHTFYEDFVNYDLPNACLEPDYYVGVVRAFILRKATCYVTTQSIFVSNFKYFSLLF